MENVNRAQDLIGNEIYDQDGQRIGRVGNVYVDDSTHQPEWVTVRTGVLGTRESFVPLQGASTEENRINVDVPREKVRQAPKIDVEQGHLSDTEGADLYTHYGLRRTGEQPTTDRQQEAGEQRETAGRGTTTPETPRTERTGTEQESSTTPKQATSGTTPDTASSLGPDSTGSMTRYEEHLRVGSEPVERGRVRLRKYVVTERESTTVPLSYEEAHIEREEIPESERRSMGSGAQLGETEQEFILHAEQPVVSAEPVAVERIRINTEKVTEERTIEGDVRRERFDVEDNSPRDTER